MERKVKAKVKKVIAEVMEVSEYLAHSNCPFCNVINETEVEQDNITIIETCWKCKEKYKVKIPKDSVY